ncbi:MAG: hypothetical protein HC897_00015 [Thermoanaerobaculia bacterium]|nr:hypothetical protein [Thermoanaerobaculia bacterium]
MMQRCIVLALMAALLLSGSVLAQGLAPSNNLPVSAATYLGGAGSDRANAMAVGLDGAVILAGQFEGYTPPGITPIDLLGGGTGAIVRFDNTGRSLLSFTRIGGQVNDIELDGAGRILVCGDFGLALLNATASELIWTATPGDSKKCSIGNEGTAAVLVGNTVSVFHSDGSPRANWQIDRVAQNVAVAGGNSLVIVSGYEQKSSQLQVAYLQAWNYDGTLAWTSYDFARSAVEGANLGADTRGEVVAIGQDGKLYFAGTINGGTGASIFSRDPKDISQRVNGVATDRFNTPSNVGSVKMTWYGRYNPADGTLELGQSLLTRLSSGRGNSIAPREITADAQGRVFLVGDTACCIENRNDRQVGGVTVGNYEGGEGFFLAVSSDFQQRLIWTPFAQPDISAGGSPATGVAVGDGLAAIGLTFNPPENGTRGLITIEALQPQPAGNAEAYVAVWRYDEATMLLVDAGSDQTVFPGAEVTLQATGQNITSYSWQQREGPTVTLEGADTALTFVYCACRGGNAAI